MGYVFISYSSKNKVLADKIRVLLDRHGIGTWMAPDDIPTGSKYAEVINKAIKNCSCVVLLLTEDSINSLWVAKETERAINYKKTVFPLQLEDVVLNDEFELYISTEQILTVDKIDASEPQVQDLLYLIKRLTQPLIADEISIKKHIVNEGISFEKANRKTVTAKSIWIMFVIVFAVLIVVLVAFLFAGKNETEKQRDVLEEAMTAYKTELAQYNEIQSVYIVDINNDGVPEIVFKPDYFNGINAMTYTESGGLSVMIMTGHSSMSPDVYISTENCIYWRDDGYNEGTAFYHRAVIYEIAEKGFVRTGEADGENPDDFDRQDTELYNEMVEKYNNRFEEKLSTFIGNKDFFAYEDVAVTENIEEYINQYTDSGTKYIFSE